MFSLVVYVIGMCGGCKARTDEYDLNLLFIYQGSDGGD